MACLYCFRPIGPPRKPGGFYLRPKAHLRARNTFCCSDNYGDAIDCSSRRQICRFRRLASHSLCCRMPTSTTVASQSGFSIKENAERGLARKFPIGFFYMGAVAPWSVTAITIILRAHLLCSNHTALKLATTAFWAWCRSSCDQVYSTV